MVLQLLGQFLYQWVEASWLVTTVLSKYFLTSIAIKAASEGERDYKEILDKVEKWSRSYLVGVLVLGLGVLLIGVEFTPLAKVFSQLVAVVHLGFLFWRY